jgi:hypothetical protein
MSSGAERHVFRQDQVYAMRRIIDQSRREWDQFEMGARDYALVQLDRAVDPRVATPLHLGPRLGMTVSAGTQLGVIGYPSGMPAKVSFGDKGYSAVIDAGSPTVFRAQLNTFHANSGSPVFYYDAPDVVAGILIAGEEDYQARIEDGGPCKQPIIYNGLKPCTETGPDGSQRSVRCSEKVTKAELIAPLVPE